MLNHWAALIRPLETGFLEVDNGAGERKALLAVMPEASASHRAGDRFGRAGPRANKRRPKPRRHLDEPRAEARKRLMGMA